MGTLTDWVAHLDTRAAAPRYSMIGYRSGATPVVE